MPVCCLWCSQAQGKQQGLLGAQDVVTVGYGTGCEQAPPTNTNTARCLWLSTAFRLNSPCHHATAGPTAGSGCMRARCRATSSQRSRCSSSKRCCTHQAWGPPPTRQTVSVIPSGFSCYSVLSVARVLQFQQQVPYAAGMGPPTYAPDCECDICHINVE